MGEEHAGGRENNRWGVLLLAHGAPDRLTDIPEFLLNVRAGRPLPEAAMAEIVERYARIGGGSPLLSITNQQAQHLAELLGRPVYVGMRNWKPFILESVQRMSGDGIERVEAVCLAPQNSRTSVGLYRKSLDEAVAKVGARFGTEFVESWHDHPDLIRAFAERIEAARSQAEAQAGTRVPIVFTAHSVPERTIAAGDPYDRQVRETAALIAKTMSLDDYRLAYQSQGMTAEPWIGPTVESTIDELAAQGHRHALIAPVGFVSDHVEILYDIDVVFREYGKTKGVTVWRSESLNDSPLFIAALASLVKSRIGA
ncbi:MAG TPA: ferrochelatase [Terriglobia bacterium]|nr:ferrochelatase [Terriglobia bacterium]